MSHHIVEVKDLYFTYHDGTPAIRGVSFRITHGESVAVVGANGAGKSTLLHHLNGSIVPKHGEVRIGDYPITKERLKEVRRTVGMVFQNPDDQLFMPRVFDDVAFGPLNYGLPSNEIEARVDKALAEVGALDLKNRSSARLSAGEKRAVSIASVLAVSPDILVLDEPNSDLDPRTRRRLIELLKTFKHTKIIATHDLDMVLDLCPRTIILAEGKVIADGNSLEIFNNEKLLKRSNLEKPLRMQECPDFGKQK